MNPSYNYIEKKTSFDWVYEVKKLNDWELIPRTIVGDTIFDAMIRLDMRIYFKQNHRAKSNKTAIKELVGSLPSNNNYLFLELIEMANGAYALLASERRTKW